MKKLLLLIVIFFISLNVNATKYYYTTQDGEITNPSTWLAGNTPQVPDFSDTSNRIYINHHLYRASTGQFYIKCYTKINSGALLTMTSVIHIDGIKAKVDVWGTLEVHNIFYVQNGGLLEIWYGGYVFTDNMVDVTGQGGALNGIIRLHGGGICWDNLWKGDYPPVGWGVLCNTPNPNSSGCCTSTGPLSIELISFNCKLIDNNVEISWITQNEINNDHFIIEKSKDLVNWVLVSNVIGGESNYKMYDRLPFNGISYYRLSQVDNDGTLTVYDKQWIRFISINDLYRINNNKIETNDTCNIAIYDTYGNAVFNGYTNSVDIKYFSRGLYIICIDGIKIKIIKQ